MLNIMGFICTTLSSKPIKAGGHTIGLTGCGISPFLGEKEDPVKYWQVAVLEVFG